MTGGITLTGGVPETGGMMARTGGIVLTGGVPVTGGNASSGGTLTGGTATRTGGMATTGGTISSGGVATGGIPTGATGGTTTGGSTATGGSTVSATGPCDIFGAASNPCVAAHSTVRALYGAYAGKLYQVQRASDKTTKDIVVLTPGGFANSTEQDAFCAGSTCTISIIYDQSPKANHLTPAPGGGANKTA